FSPRWNAPRWAGIRCGTRWSAGARRRPREPRWKERADREWGRGFLYSPYIRLNAKIGERRRGVKAADHLVLAGCGRTCNSEPWDYRFRSEETKHGFTSWNAHHMAGTCHGSDPDRQGHQAADRSLHRAESQISPRLRTSVEDRLCLADARARRPHFGCCSGGEETRVHCGGGV